MPGAGAVKGDDGLLAAYRQGLALAAIVVIDGAAGARIAAAPGGEPQLQAGESIAARWWCRRAEEADRVAAAAEARRRAETDADTLAAANAAIMQAAKRRQVALQPDEEMFAEARSVIDRVEAELEALRQSGDLRSVNRSYRTYRLEATARGERIVPYTRWLAQYKEGLVRRLATALRQL